MPRRLAFVCYGLARALLTLLVAANEAIAAGAALRVLDALTQWLG